MVRTISDIRCLDDFEFLLDIRVKKAVEIKSVRTFLPSGEVSYFIPVSDKAFRPKLVDVAHFRINGGQEKARICDRPITDIAWTVVPCKPDTGIIFPSLPFTFGGSFRGKKLHDACHRIRGAVPD